MKNVLTFLILLLYMNTAMVCPAVDEVDRYDHYGQEIDDINSVFEYINQIVLGNEDDTPEDEDNDEANFFNANFHSPHYSPEFRFTFIQNKAFAILSQKLTILSENLVSHSYREVPTPPPDSYLQS